VGLDLACQLRIEFFPAPRGLRCLAQFEIGRRFPRPFLEQGTKFVERLGGPGQVDQRYSNRWASYRSEFDHNDQGIVE